MRSVREIEPLLQAGLIKGGDLDNAIVIYEREMSAGLTPDILDACPTFSGRIFESSGRVKTAASGRPCPT